MFICSLRIRSKNWDIFEKPLQHNSNSYVIHLERHMDKEALMRVRAARQRMGEGKEIDMEQHMGHGPIQWKKNF